MLSWYAELLHCEVVAHDETVAVSEQQLAC